MAELKADGAGYLAEAACAVLKKKGEALGECDPKAPEQVAAPVEEKLPEIDKNNIALDWVKSFAGPLGEQLTMAAIKGQDGLILVKFQGVQGAWNDKVMLHKLAAGGTRYWTQHGAEKWVSVVEGNGAFIVTIPGQKSFTVRYAGQEQSAAVDKVKLLREFDGR